jgi:hypothetical protein
MLKKLIDKIKHLFYTSYLGLIYFNILLWWDKKKFDKELARRPSNIATKIAYNAVKASYNEGISKIKGEVAKLIQSRSKDEYERVLNNINDMLSLAQSERKEEIESLKKVYLYKDKDIQNDTDKARMINSRINDYKDLHKHIEKRNKLRKERKNNG